MAQTILPELHESSQRKKWNEKRNKKKRRTTDNLPSNTKKGRQNLKVISNEIIL